MEDRPIRTRGMGQEEQLEEAARWWRRVVMGTRHGEMVCGEGISGAAGGQASSSRRGNRVSPFLKMQH